jgi:fructose-bisphosphate aldolase class I
VPIVEPEVLIDGDHSHEQCQSVTEMVLRAVFAALARHKVLLEYIILKPSMVISGQNNEQQSTVEQVARDTLTVLKRTVPSAVPSINFLSGGQTPEQATDHLNAMNQLGPQPWNISFSYARALQDPCLKTWRGDDNHVKAAQQALYRRAYLNSLAAAGQYNKQMENQAVTA